MLRGMDTDDKPQCIFRRPLPIPPAVASFDSPFGQQLLLKSMTAGTAQAYFGLSQQYRTQDEPAFCGLSTLVMVLNSLKVDPKKIWKGVWRWYHETMLDCCLPLDVIKEQGVTLQEFKCLATCNGLKPALFVNSFEEDNSLETFRQTVKECCMSCASEKVLVISYSRKEFLQTGDGHFTTIAAYSEEEDVILVLDVARFKYPAHWVTVEGMWRAMQRLDETTGKQRGYMVLQASEYQSSILFTLRSGKNMWPRFQSFSEVLKKVQCADPCLNAVACFLDQLPHDTIQVIQTFEEAFDFRYLPYRPKDHEEALERIKQEVKELKLCSLIEERLTKQKIKTSETSLVMIALLFLAFPLPKEFTSCFGSCGELRDVSNASELLQREVSILRTQLEAMIDADPSPGESNCACTSRN